MPGTKGALGKAQPTRRAVFESRVPRCDSREALHCLARRFVLEHENTFKLKSVSKSFRRGKAPLRSPAIGSHNQTY